MRRKNHRRVETEHPRTSQWMQRNWTAEMKEWSSRECGQTSLFPFSIFIYLLLNIDNLSPRLTVKIKEHTNWYIRPIHPIPYLFFLENSQDQESKRKMRGKQSIAMNCAFLSCICSYLPCALMHSALPATFQMFIQNYLCYLCVSAIHALNPTDFRI